MTNKIPFRIRPMLATLVDQPFDEPGWTYEEKYDGVRLVAYKEGKQVSLITRNDIDRARDFPKIADAIGALPSTTLLLDGEVVVFDRRRVSRFQLLQQGKAGAVYAAFDCLYVNGTDLRREPLSTRRARLEEVLVPSEVLTVSRRLASNGLEAFRIAKRKGFEGLVAKRLSSPYIQKRTREWLKVKVHQEDEFVVVGFTEPEGSRKFFGALLLGAYKNGKLEYAGRVGTGFDGKTLASLHRRFQPLIRRAPAVLHLPRMKGVTFLSPKLVAQISYAELTEDGKLRQPVYLGLREDKAAKDVSLPEAK
jgi:bifunctional non-homologous end joining protein LigD